MLIIKAFIHRINDILYVFVVEFFSRDADASEHNEELISSLKEIFVTHIYRKTHSKYIQLHFYIYVKLEL